MSLRIPVLGLALALSGLPAAAQEGSSQVTVSEDLLAVLTLRGKPCGEVVETERRGESDYLVTCSDGHRYRIHVDESQRVVIEER